MINENSEDLKSKVYRLKQTLENYFLVAFVTGISKPTSTAATVPRKAVIYLMRFVHIRNSLIYYAIEPSQLLPMFLAESVSSPVVPLSDTTHKNLQMPIHSTQMDRYISLSPTRRKNTSMCSIHTITNLPNLRLISTIKSNLQSTTSRNLGFPVL